MKEAFHSHTVCQSWGMQMVKKKKKRKNCLFLHLSASHAHFTHIEPACIHVLLWTLYIKHTHTLKHTPHFGTNRWHTLVGPGLYWIEPCKDLWEICSWNVPFIHRPLNPYRTMMLTHTYMNVCSTIQTVCYSHWALNETTSYSKHSIMSSDNDKYLKMHADSWVCVQCHGEKKESQGGSSYSSLKCVSLCVGV